MRATLRRSLIGAYLSLLMWCSAAAATEPAKLPAEVPFNRSAGRGDPLFFMVQLEDGNASPFMLDAGCSASILDSSLEPKLGKCLGTQTVQYGWLGKRANRVYKTPRLYLGGVELKSEDRIWVDDVVHRAYCVPPLLGILSMDCLQHYCIQLDFIRNKMRFLDPEHLDDKPLGKAFRLTIKQGQVFVDENLLGVRGAKTIIDTADCSDGGLNGKLFEREFQDRKRLWSRELKLPSGGSAREACFASGPFGGESYTNLLLEDCSASRDPKMNVIGLRFLARHLVTFNFPKRTMYLKRACAGPLADEDVQSAARFLKGLKEAGHLPGWSKEEQGENVRARYLAGMFADTYPISLTIDIQKRGDQATYHYLVEQLSREGQWRMLKAWQTDQNGRAIAEYPGH
jgi:hypothetical protein